MTSDFTDLNGSGTQQVWLSVTRTGQDTVNNQSDYSWELRYYGNGYGSWSTTTQSWSVNIGGETASGTFTIPQSEAFNTYKKIGSGSVSIDHAADGTKAAFACTGTINTDHSSIGDGSASFTEPAPPTIPRASVPTWANGSSSKTTGVLAAINMNKKSTSFTHTISWAFGTLTGQTTGFSATSGIVDSVNWTPPDSMFTQVTNGVSGAGTITVTTKNGSTTVGSKTLAFTVTAGSAVKPAVTSVTLAEQTALVTSQVGAYVQDLSVLKGTVNSTESYGANITSESWSTGGVSVADGANISLKEAGSVAIGGAATDARGRTGTYSTNITVMPYVKPTITSASVRRSNSDGTPNPDNGLYVAVDMNALVQTLVVSTVQKNSMTVKLSYRAYGASTWILSDTLVQAAGVVATPTFTKVLTNGTGTAAGIFPIANSFEVKVEVLDKFNTSTQTLVIATAAVFMHWSATGVGIGKYHTQGSLDVAGAIYQNNLAVIDTGDAATTSVKGIIELATQAEVDAATDTTRAVTPATLSATPGYWLKQTVYFRSNGTFTKASYSGLKGIRVRTVGGGGAGGSCAAAGASGHSAGGGGGGGGYAEAFITAANIATSVTVTVGAGGTTVASAGGNSGGDSSFGTQVVASGGLGGGYKNNYSTAGIAAAATAGSGGAGTTGDLKIDGAPGGLGAGFSTIGHGGQGGSSQLGGGGHPKYTGAGGGSIAGTAGGDYGGGGSGGAVNASGAAVSGGVGAPGIVIIDVYI